MPQATSSYVDPLHLFVLQNRLFLIISRCCVRKKIAKVFASLLRIPLHACVCLDKTLYKYMQKNFDLRGRSASKKVKKIDFPVPGADVMLDVRIEIGSGVKLTRTRLSSELT
jgi:hypothetical protein